MLSGSLTVTVRPTCPDRAVAVLCCDSQFQLSWNVFCVVFIFQLYLEQVFLGYMRLLLNSRDELSLARVINVPCRGLDHRAFTDVKHESKERGLSMFQVNSIDVMLLFASHCS